MLLLQSATCTVTIRNLYIRPFTPCGKYVYKEFPGVTQV